ncbi:MAG: hypothetical protein V4719_27670 [Planctomycetota bacterium]
MINAFFLSAGMICQFVGVMLVYFFALAADIDETQNPGDKTGANTARVYEVPAGDKLADIGIRFLVLGALLQLAGWIL